jgi:hypothetical protein
MSAPVHPRSPGLKAGTWADGGPGERRTIYHVSDSLHQGRATDNVMRAHSIHVLNTGTTGVAALTVFLDPGLFSAFGLPPTR